MNRDYFASSGHVIPKNVGIKTVISLTVQAQNKTEFHSRGKKQTVGNFYA